MRNGEYEGYVGVVADLRKTLAGQLARWYAGDRSDLRAGSVLGIALALASLHYGRGVDDELTKARRAAHLINHRRGVLCSCGTTKRCLAQPGPEALIDEVLTESERFQYIAG